MNFCLKKKLKGTANWTFTIDFYYKILINNFWFAKFFIKGNLERGKKNSRPEGLEFFRLMIWNCQSVYNMIFNSIFYDSRSVFYVEFQKNFFSMCFYRIDTYKELFRDIFAAKAIANQF